MLQVFDVRNPYDPKRTAQLKLGGTSEAEYNHHAFLWWAPTSEAFVPNNFYEPSIKSEIDSLAVVRVKPDEISLRGDVFNTFETKAGPDSWTGGLSPVARSGNSVTLNDVVVRSLIVNGRLVTVGRNTMKVSNLSTLQQNQFTAFPPFGPTS